MNDLRVSKGLLRVRVRVTGTVTLTLVLGQKKLVVQCIR